MLVKEYNILTRFNTDKKCIIPGYFFPTSDWLYVLATAVILEMGQLGHIISFQV